MGYTIYMPTSYSGRYSHQPTCILQKTQIAYNGSGDGWRNADAGACQHWRPGCSLQMLIVMFAD